MNHETHETHGKILFKEECFAIQGAVFEVYREMGCGFLEAVYQECLEKEPCRQNIPFISQKELSLFYKGEQLPQIYKPDIGDLEITNIPQRRRDAEKNILKLKNFSLRLRVSAVNKKNF